MASATPSSDSARRANVEKAYRDRIPDATWDSLKRKDYVTELENGLLSVEEVVDVIRDWNQSAPKAQALGRRRVQGAGTSSGSLFEGLNSRLQALAQVIAWRAGRSSTVVSFRDRYLASGLIAAEEVTGWIDTTYHRTRPSKWPARPGPTQANNFRGNYALWPHAHVDLEWLDKEESTTKVWCVPRRGPLAELAKLSSTLADQWDWNLALATNFVLTGETPARPGVRGLSFRTRTGSDGYYGSYRFMSVGCVIDVETTPEQLAAWWRGVRTYLGISGRRPMGEKAIQLALFALGSDDETTYAQDMERWNAQVPDEWQYHDYRNFRTAAHAAIDALNKPADGCSVP